MNKTEFFKLVKKHITVVREQGSTPPLDLDHISLKEDHYICDLCKQPLTIARFTQCGLCGRWICKDECWDMENSICINCAGVIKLVKKSFLMAGAVEDDKLRGSLKKRILEKFSSSENIPSAESGEDSDRSSSEKDPIDE